MGNVKHVKDGCYSVTSEGHDEWLMRPGGASLMVGLGVSGNHVWFCRSNREIRIFKIENDKPLYQFELPKDLESIPSYQHESPTCRKPKDEFVYKPISGVNISAAIGSSDGHHIYLITGSPRHIVIVDIASGEIVGNFPIPSGQNVFPLLDDQGRIILSMHKRNPDDSAEYGVCRIDPANGHVETFTEVMEDSTYGFTQRSPDGRYWLKQDRAQFPMRKDEKTGEAYYGIYVQLWDVFPLRYIRTLLVEWRSFSKFDGSNTQKKREHLEKLTKEAAKESAGPTGKAFAPKIHMQTIKWEADGQAFMWLSHPDVYRVTLNGTCEKIGSYQEILYPKKKPGSPQTVVKTKADALKTNASTFSFELPFLSSAGCITALQAFADKMDVNLVDHTRSVSDIEVKFSYIKKSLFSKKSLEIPYDEFFALLGRKHPESAPALVMLIEKYIQSMRPHPHSTVYIHNGDGEGLMHAPSMALLQFKGNYLNLLRQYGATIDHDHEWQFKHELIPAAIKKHGYAPETIEFILWAIMFVVDAKNENHEWFGPPLIKEISKSSVEEITLLALNIAKFPEFKTRNHTGINCLKNWLVSQSPTPNSWPGQLLKSIEPHAALQNAER